MIQRIQRTLALLILVFSLIGATPAISQDYAIVDDNPITARGYYLTIGAALQSAATTIEVRDGAYPESVTIDRPITLLCRDGATLLNSGAGVSIYIAAPGVTIRDCEIEGNHDGNPDIGDYWNGTGIHDLAGYSHIDGLKTRNLRGFSYINATANANNVILENFNFQNVGTVRDEHKCVQYSILFIGENEGHIIRNGRVRGTSEAIGLWYGVSRTTVQGNTLNDNYGWIGANCNGARSAIEDYGLGRGNTGNRYLDNIIDGTNGWGFELADVLFDTLVSRNTTRNTYGGAFGVWGSGMNRGVNMRIEGNTFYGLGGGVWDKSNMFGGDGVISGNRFINYLENNTGAILIPSAEVGRQVIRDNEFINSGLITRVATGGVLIEGNEANVTQYNTAIYIDPTVTGLNTIRNNYLEAYGHRVINAPYSPVRFEGNETMGGVIEVATGSWVIGNDVTVMDCGWTALIAQTGGVYRENIIRCDGIPILVPSATDNALIERNFVTRLDGSANSNLPACSGTNTCSGNWTVGQVPPTGTD